MKSHGTLSRFPLVFLGILVLAAMGFMAYLSTVHPVAPTADTEKEISLQTLSATTPSASPAPAMAAPAQLPVPETSSHDDATQ